MLAPAALNLTGAVTDIDAAVAKSALLGVAIIALDGTYPAAVNPLVFPTGVSIRGIHREGVVLVGQFELGDQCTMATLTVTGSVALTGDDARLEDVTTSVGVNISAGTALAENVETDDFLIGAAFCTARFVTAAGSLTCSGASASFEGCSFDNISTTAATSNTLTFNACSTSTLSTLNGTDTVELSNDSKFNAMTSTDVVTLTQRDSSLGVVTLAGLSTFLASDSFFAEFVGNDATVNMRGCSTTAGGVACAALLMLDCPKVLGDVVVAGVVSTEITGTLIDGDVDLGGTQTTTVQNCVVTGRGSLKGSANVASHCRFDEGVATAGTTFLFSDRVGVLAGQASLQIDDGSAVQCEECLVRSNGTQAAVNVDGTSLVVFTGDNTLEPTTIAGEEVLVSGTGSHRVDGTIVGSGIFLTTPQSPEMGAAGSQLPLDVTAAGSLPGGYDLYRCNISGGGTVSLNDVANYFNGRPVVVANVDATDAITVQAAGGQVLNGGQLAAVTLAPGRAAIFWASPVDATAGWYTTWAPSGGGGGSSTLILFAAPEATEEESLFPAGFGENKYVDADLPGTTRQLRIQGAVSTDGTSDVYFRLMQTTGAGAGTFVLLNGANDFLVVSSSVSTELVSDPLTLVDGENYEVQCQPQSTTTRGRASFGEIFGS